MSSFLNVDLPSEDEDDEDFVADERDGEAKPKAKAKPTKRCAAPRPLGRPWRPPSPERSPHRPHAAPASALSAPADAPAKHITRPAAPQARRGQRGVAEAGC